MGSSGLGWARCTLAWFLRGLGKGTGSRVAHLTRCWVVGLCFAVLGTACRCLGRGGRVGVGGGHIWAERTSCVGPPRGRASDLVGPALGGRVWSGRWCGLLAPAGPVAGCVCSVARLVAGGVLRRRRIAGGAGAVCRVGARAGAVRHAGLQHGNATCRDRPPSRRNVHSCFAARQVPATVHRGISRELGFGCTSTGVPGSGAAFVCCSCEFELLAGIFKRRPHT